MKLTREVCIGGTVVLVCGIVAAGIAWALLRSLDDLPPPSRQTLPVLDWWEHCVLYQVYTRSFKDSDGDGIGDLKGIIDELDHFVDSGVEAIWLSPIFESPMVDFGYDISNYYDIHHEYGNMKDFEDLLRKAHVLGLKVLLDIVPNHASIESEYFQNSEADEPEYRDYFVWAEPVWTDMGNETIRQPPSNWVSLFGGSAWEWSEVRQKYYLHQFAVEQADFNFRNPAVMDEIINIMKYWLDKGVDGFRLDALPYLVEAYPEDFNGSYPDEPLSGISKFSSNQLGYTIPIHTKDLLELYDIVYEWRKFVDDYKIKNGGDTRVLFSEAYANISMTMLYYGDEDGSLGTHFPFNFGFITDLSDKSDARDFVYTILKWLTYKPSGSVANWVFGNHDNKRMASRFRDDMVDGLNALNLMLPGVAVTYQGEEIGMRDGYVSWQDTVDVEARNRGNNDTYLQYTRDPARTPFHWNDDMSAGFSTNENTWLPIADDYTEINLAQQRESDTSHYKVYQTLTCLRKEPTLSHGLYDINTLSRETFYLIRRLKGHDSYTLVFNVGEEEDEVDLSRIPQLELPARVVTASVFSEVMEGKSINQSNLTLRPGEALVLKTSPVTDC
ncbi:maltase 2-like [Plodia interpunctella]|uniref:maltase 2-like n=1 Tax=Plodia interpunctella TaxID=58824 RepID=UPI0023687A6E|nr:maltase 2-like [Plodia interpunctella]